MSAAADRTPAAGDHAREVELRAIATRLRAALPRVPSAFRAGRAALVKTLAELESSSTARATKLLSELTELGCVRYTTEGRGIGAAGVWTYPRAATNPTRRSVRARRRA